MAQFFSRRWLFTFFVLPVSLFIGLIVSTAGAAAWPQVKDVMAGLSGAVTIAQ